MAIPRAENRGTVGRFDAMGFDGLSRKVPHVEGENPDGARMDRGCEHMAVLRIAVHLLDELLEVPHERFAAE